jgi:hypothetical protein
MNRIKLLTLASLLLCGYGVTAQAALVDIALTPADCTIGVCWTANPNSNPSLSDIETLVGTTDLTSLYKQDVGKKNDAGPYAKSYTTIFNNSSTDPADALIQLITGKDPITCGECYLLVKGGNQEPSLYVFALTGEINSITLTEFWPAQGAISHLEIVGGISPVPVPASVWLFGTALIGFIGLSRRTKV